MGRSPQFQQGDFVAAAQGLIAREGPAGLTVQKIAEAAGATTGSVYHRFPSLPVLSATAGIEATESFQAGFAQALAGKDLFAAVLSGALHTPRYSRRHPTEVQVLLRFDLAELSRADLPPPLKRRLLALKRDLKKRLLGLLRRFGRKPGRERVDLLRFLLVDMPLSAVAPYLRRNEEPPAHIDDFIEQSVRAFRKELQGEHQ